MDTELEATVRALFRRWPALCGFSVQEARTLSAEREAGPLEGELCLADLSLAPWAGPGECARLSGEIGVALLDLLDECPEARELLRGRTFARTLH